MAYEALEDWLDPALVLAAKGQRWEFPVPTARTVVELKKLFLDTGAVIDDDTEAQWSERIAGPDLWESLWDAPEITRAHVLRTALIHYGIDSTTAHAHWVGAEAAGKVLRALEEQETTAPPAPTAPKTPAAARTTRKRASAPGTSTGATRRRAG